MECYNIQIASLNLSEAGMEIIIATGCHELQQLGAMNVAEELENP